MKKIYLIYDDITKPTDKLKEIIGNSRFSEIIYKRESLESITLKNIEKIPSISESFYLKCSKELKNLQLQIKNNTFDSKILHIFSNSVITDFEKFDLLINILHPSNSNILITNESGKMLMLFFNNTSDYINYLEVKTNNLSILNLKNIQNTCLYDISNYKNLTHYLSRSFNVRYFNFISCDNDIVTKKSFDKIKMKKEHDFYYFLPENLRNWFVKPYDYNEDKEYAYYSMQHYNMPDMAIRWTHKALSLKEFDLFLKKAFQFINQRSKKTVGLEKVKEIKNNLYVEKLQQRIEKLQQHKEFHIIDSYIKTCTKYKDIDEIIEYYKDLYFKITNPYTPNNILVIGHGDFCFSNILYDEQDELFKLIDAKGALNEQDLWTDEYYDIVKLSHSICGLYDFFNNNLYKIEAKNNKTTKLTINFENSEYIELFKKYLIENNFDYNLVRIYEASLFLSMLPLHMDYPDKVFGFLLNGLNILKDLEQSFELSKPDERQKEAARTK